MSVSIYTDGSCLKPNGPSGWGFVMLKNGTIWEVSGGEEKSTNNRMELIAVIEALKFDDNRKYIIFSDSLYVIKGITEWMDAWKRRCWKKVKNVDLWQELDSVVRGKNVEWRWVKSHSGDKYNERADFLAKKEAKKFLF